MSHMECTSKPPAIAEYLASVLVYCPETGVFYSSSVHRGEPKGELHGTPIYGVREPMVCPDTGRMLIRAGHKYNRRAVHAAKLAWYLTYNEWPYFVGHKYGLADLRVMGLKALMTPGEYQATMGDLTYWQRAFVAMPDLPAKGECQVVWYPGLSPEVEEQ